MFWPTRRATLLIPSGPDHDLHRKHLFIILTDPVPAPNSPDVLLVGIATRRAGVPHDSTCILYPGDHEFITDDSYVNYGRARIEKSETLIAGVGQGLLIPRGTIDAGIFAHICQGLIESRQTAPKILHFYHAAVGQS